ncbi:hypothetical protein [Streptomyces sp. NPDC085937]|uniref:hypothetical protein n=1 Tax=Streptomyces sp. NPDC085937 TaxID=3365742 RepID=UPI0037D086AD
MPKRKIVDEGEVVRWFEEGWTYQQMIEEYRRKYGIDTVSSMWGNFRHRKGLRRRIARDDDLIPWAVKAEHRHQYPLAMLRVEGRYRAGMDLDENSAKRLESWRRTLAEENAVVHYDPDTKEGFFYVPREPHDDDLIRRPRRKTTLRRNADERRDT